MNTKKPKYNRSTTYLLPLTLWGIKFNKEAIINTYIYSIQEPEFNSQEVTGLFIEVAYQYESKETFQYFNRCKYLKDIDGNSFIMFFEAPLLVKDDIQKLAEGKFSKIKSIAKDAILKYGDFKSTSAHYGVLYKTEKYRRALELDLNVRISENAELGSIFDLEKEVFNKKLKNKIIKDE